MNLQDWTAVATIAGVVAAVAVYILNSLAAKRQRMIENLERFIQAHDRAFGADSYPELNVLTMEKGTFKRDPSDEEMERRFNRFLGQLEELALLRNAGAVPSSTSAYMLGWFAKQIYPVVTDREKAEPYWALAIEFLRETKREAEELDKMPTEDLLKYIKSQHAK